MKAFHFPSSGSLCGCLLSSLREGVPDAPFNLWRSGNKVALLPETPGLEAFLLKEIEKWGGEVLPAKALKTDPRFAEYEEQKFQSIRSALGILLRAQLHPAEETRPTAVVVEVRSFEEFHALLVESLMLEENEIFYAPQTCAGHLFLKILSPPFYLLEKWLRRSIPLYTPSLIPGVFTPWGMDFPFSIEHGFPSGMLIRQDGTLCYLSEEMKDLRAILQIDTTPFKELSVQWIDFPPFQIPLTLEPSDASGEPTLWLTSEQARIERFLARFPEFYLGYTHIGAFQDGTQPVFLVFFEMPLGEKVDLFTTQILERSSKAFYSYRLETLFLPVGYVLKPFVSRESLAKAFWEQESPESSLVILEETTPIRYRRFPISGLMTGPDAVRYFVEKKEEALKPLVEKFIGQGDDLWKAFVSETRRAGWLASFLKRLRGKV